MYIIRSVSFMPVSHRLASVKAVRCSAVPGTRSDGDFHLETVPVSHDANEPIAVIVTSIAEGSRAGIVYDLGHVTETVLRALDKLDLLVIEANHDEGMLRAGPYPPSVQARIRFSSTSGYGAGLGACLNPETGAHYAAWVYPENSGGGPSPCNTGAGGALVITVYRRASRRRAAWHAVGSGMFQRGRRPVHVVIMGCGRVGSTLAQSLEATVESCVNRVGVDLNTASHSLLRYVAGINERMAQKVVAYRNEHGRFRSRVELVSNAFRPRR